MRQDRKTIIIILRVTSGCSAWRTDTGSRGPGGKIGLPGGGGTREVIEYFYRPYIGFLGRKTLVIELNERTKNAFI